MKVELRGWSAKGFRCPDIEVDLRRGGDVPRVGLIQMPNGTGKTTTLELLRAALTGNATKWDPDRIQSMAKKDDSVRRGQFEVDLAIDGQGMTIELVLDYVDGDAQYKTSYKDAGGILHEWDPPNAVKKFLTDQFIKLFIFDGELAPKLIESEKHEAERALDALFQLHLFDSMEDVAERKWEREIKDKGGKTEIAKTRRENKLKKIRKKITKVEKARKNAVDKKEILEDEIDDKKEEIKEKIDEVKELRNRRKKADKKIKKAEGKIQKRSESLMRDVRSPQKISNSFSEAIGKLKGSLDTLKLPSNTSKQFFVELSKQDECICGSKIDEQSKHTILKRAEDFLGEEISGFINTLKLDIDKYINERPNFPSKDVQEAKDDLAEAISQRIDAEGDLRAVKEDLSRRGDEKVEELEEEKEEKEEELGNLKDLLDEIDGSPEPGDKNDPEETFCLQALREMEEEAKQELSEIADTLELRAQIDELTDILQESQERARTRLKAAIVKECRQRLGEILSFNPVEIDEISGSLKLKNQKGASVGQTLAVAYTFLTTLLGRGKHQFPLVVDSPANPIDNTVRSEIASVIPDLTDQFVAFTISSERTGFTDYLDKSADGDVKYLTLFRKNEHTQPLVEDLPSNGVDETKDGVLVEGREYFNQFDDKEAKVD